jgi:hypothetical protein
MIANNRNNNSQLVSKAFLESVFFVGLFSIFFYLNYLIIFQKTSCWTDYRSHIFYAKQFFIDGKSVGFHHLGFHFLLFIFHKLFSLTFEYASVFVSSISLTATAFIIYKISIKELGNIYSNSVILLIAQSLMVVTPIFAAYYGISIYRGTWSPNVWHNPTIVLVKPFAFIVVYMFMSLYENDYLQKSYRYILAIVIFVSISIFMKPNFFICFAIAILIFIILKRSNKRLFIITFLIILLPSVFLIIQYLLTYNGTYDSSIGFGFFTIWDYFSSNIPGSIAFSMAFPLMLFIFSPRNALKDDRLLFAWILFLVGFVQFSFLTEEGPRKFHANWVWGYQIAMHILFVYSILHLFKEYGASNVRTKWANIKLYCLTIVYMLHYTSGIYYLMKIIGGGNCT